MAKIVQINVSRNDVKNYTLTFYLVNDVNETKFVDVEIEAKEFDAFFNMFAQIHQTIQNSNSNPFVTMGEFSVSLPTDIQKPRFYRKTDLQRLLSE